MNKVWGFLIGFGIMAVILAFLFNFNWGTTQTGSVNASGCRATVELNQGDWATYWHTFSCSYVLGEQECEAVSMNGNQCDTFYYYYPKNSSGSYEFQ